MKIRLEACMLFLGVIAPFCAIPYVAVAQNTVPSQIPLPPSLATPPSATPPAAGAPAAPAGSTDSVAQPASDAPLTTIRVQSNEVNLVFAVTDKKGHFITGLQQQDFGLSDNSRQVDQVLRLQQQTNLPLRVGLMIDTSSSIRDRFQFEQDAAVDFLKQTIHPADSAFVEGFDTSLDREQDFTSSVDKLAAGVQKLRPGGGTALYDALFKTCRDQMLSLSRSQSVRKVIVLVSDGEDNYSRLPQKEAVQECLRAETMIYSISTNISASRTKGDDVLRILAEQTGGSAFYPNKLADITGYFKNIQEELRSQYLLVYRPPDFNNDGSFHAIQVMPRNRTYLVRAKRGYFAPRPVQAMATPPAPLP